MKFESLVAEFGAHYGMGTLAPGRGYHCRAGAG